MEKSVFFIASIFSLLFLIVGFFVGFFTNQNFSQVTPCNIQTSPIVKVLNSKVIPSIFATGKVTKISDTSIKLSQEGDSVDIGVGKDTKIYSVYIPTPTAGQNKTSAAPVQIGTTLAAIKVGDSLTINVKILSDGKVAATSIFITPQLTAPNIKK